MQAARASWERALTVRGFRLLAVLSLPLLTVTLLVLRRFLNFIEARPGVVLADPVLALIPTHNVSHFVFGVMWATLLGGALVLVARPRRLVTGVWAYCILMWARMAVMYLLPLDPPRDLVPLHDPFVAAFGQHTLLTRDLFFSGHTATLCLYALVMPPGWARRLTALATTVVATGVLIHHAHYTVDVVAAPFFSLASLRLAGVLMHRVAPAPKVAG